MSRFLHHCLLFLAYIGHKRFCCRVVFSCTKDIYINEKKYDTGELKAKEFFYSKQDSITFEVITYFKTGEVNDTLYYNRQGRLDGVIYSNNKQYKYEVWNTYVDGFRMGLTKVNKYDGTYIYQHYYNDTLNGIEYHFNRNNKITRKAFIVKNN